MINVYKKLCLIQIRPNLPVITPNKKHLWKQAVPTTYTLKTMIFPASPLKVGESFISS